eukprot:7598272-Pyramimonas_sp.AAC.1
MGTRHLTRSTPRKKRSTTKATCNVAPPGDAEEAQGGSPIHDQVAACLKSGLRRGGRSRPTGCRWTAGRKPALHRQRAAMGSSHTNNAL